MGRSQSIAYRQEFDSYIGFLYWADELTELEKKVFKRYEDWFIKVEKRICPKAIKWLF